ncbi:MAG: ankyrin repeat domain-containing protein [Myxococcota bacterium]|nr:ankyrin repeat domain-containing protein [Myxococcota bacterium]
MFHKDLAAVEAALSAGASIQTTPKGLHTPLASAASRGFVDGVKLLLDRGANVNGADWSGMTALFRAGSAAIVKILVDAGAAVDARDKSGSTPLHLAAINHTASIAALVARGADPAAVDAEGKTALEHACFHLKTKAAEILLDSMKLTPEQGARALRIAAGRDGTKGLQLVQLLLARGADPNGMPPRATTPLHKTPYSGRLDVALLLIDAGADVNARNEVDETPLLAAAHCRRIDLCQALRAAGADPNARCSGRHPDPTRRGKTPLEVATAYGKAPLIAALA